MNPLSLIHLSGMLHNANSLVISVDVHSNCSGDCRCHAVH